MIIKPVQEFNELDLRTHSIHYYSFVGLHEIVDQDNDYSLDNLLNKISALFGYTPLQMASTYRGRDLVDCRQLYYLIAMDYCGHTCTSIGGKINRDHSTVLHGKENAKISIQNITRIKQKFNECLSMFGLSEPKVLKN